MSKEIPLKPLAVTLSLPCYLRPERTKRALNCIANQTMGGFEVLMVGDNCPVIADIIKSDTLKDLKKFLEKRDIFLRVSNLKKNYGHHGYHITNLNIQNAVGKYFMFYANDDIIKHNHIENYYMEIAMTQNDFMYFDSYVAPTHHIRYSSLQFGCIGHSELIIKTDFLRKMPKHSPKYGHDWHLIEQMIKFGKHNKAFNSDITYHVMSLPNNPEKNID